MIDHHRFARPLAALDIGSNTIRLILASPEEGLRAKKVYQRLPRLSQGLEAGKPFHPAARARARKVLAGFNRLLRAAGAASALAGATMAARLAADGPEFMAGLERDYGWRVRILSGEEEARLTVRGVLSGLAPPPADGLIFDVGGRSTELSLLKSGRLSDLISLDLGVVALTESFLRHDPPRPDELAALGQTAKDALAKGLKAINAGRPALIGTAGTVTTVAAMIMGLADYRPDRVNGARVGRAGLENLYRLLAGETCAERARRPGLPPARADVIVAGLIIVLALMGLTGNDSLLVSDSGLLEGLWLEMAENFNP